VPEHVPSAASASHPKTRLNTFHFPSPRESTSSQTPRNIVYVVYLSVLPCPTLQFFRSVATGVADNRLNSLPCEFPLQSQIPGPKPAPTLPAQLTLPTMSQSAQGGGGGGVDISTLSVQQLSALQARLSQELEHLSTSYQRLRAAQARFRDCIKSIQDGVEGKSGGTSIALIALHCTATFLYILHIV
jgi:hypothetical protein